MKNEDAIRLLKKIEVLKDEGVTLEEYVNKIVEEKIKEMNNKPSKPDKPGKPKEV